LISVIASHEGGEACVCELTAGFQVFGPTISHHLPVLRIQSKENMIMAKNCIIGIERELIG
jgi:hypothetical protein